LNTEHLFSLLLFWITITVPGIWLPDLLVWLLFIFF
jgi:hypothetical protein